MSEDTSAIRDAVETALESVLSDGELGGHKVAKGSDALTVTEPELGELVMWQ